MSTHADNLSHWFDTGHANGWDTMLVAHFHEQNVDEPVYATVAGFPAVYQDLLHNAKLIILEIYDLHENKGQQLWEHRSWHPPVTV